MDKINIRNIYIDLLNKIKNVEGVDKDYVDNLIDLIDQHLTSMDSSINAIESLIPESASASDPLIIESELADVALSGSYNDLDDKPTIPGPQVNSDWDAVGGVSEILNKPLLEKPVIRQTTITPSDWVSGADYYTYDIPFISDSIDDHIPPIVWPVAASAGIEPSSTNKANFNLIVGGEWYFDSIYTTYNCRLYTKTRPTGNITCDVLAFALT